jgi:hypothetical protein
VLITATANEDLSSLVPDLVLFWPDIPAIPLVDNFVPAARRYIIPVVWGFVASSGPALAHC